LFGLLQAESEIEFLRQQLDETQDTITARDEMCAQKAKEIEELERKIAGMVTKLEAIPILEAQVKIAFVVCDAFVGICFLLYALLQGRSLSGGLSRRARSASAGRQREREIGEDFEGIQYPAAPGVRMILVVSFRTCDLVTLQFLFVFGSDEVQNNLGETRHNETRRSEVRQKSRWKIISVKIQSQDASKSSRIGGLTSQS